MSKRFAPRILMVAILVLFPALVWDADAKCKPDRIEITRSSGFGLSFGTEGASLNGNDQFYAGIPVEVKGKRGCWTQKTKLGFKIDATTTSNKGMMDIFPVQGEFENVPGGTMDTYVLVEGRAPNVFVHAFSVVCAGKSVLSLESFSGKTSVLQQESANVSATTQIAVGMAAKNAKQSSGDIPEAFLLQVQRTPLTRDKAVCATCIPEDRVAEVSVPSVSVGSIISMPGLDSRSTFSTVQLRQRICSEEIRALLAPFKVETYAQTRDANGMSVDYSKWRKRLRVKWQ